MKLLFSAVCLATAIVSSADVPRCAVLGFRPEKAEITDSLGSVVSANLVRSHAVSIVERSQLNLLTKEIKLTESGLIDDSSVPTMGKFKDVKYLIYGSVLSLSQSANNLITINGSSPITYKLDVEIRVTDVESGQIVLDEKIQGSRSSGVQAAIDDVAAQFTKRMFTIAPPPDIAVIDVDTSENVVRLEAVQGLLRSGDILEIGYMSERKTITGALITEFHKISKCQITQTEKDHAVAVTGELKKDFLGRETFHRENDQLSKLLDVVKTNPKLIARFGRD